MKCRFRQDVLDELDETQTKEREPEAVAASADVKEAVADILKVKPPEKPKRRERSTTTGKK